MGQRIRWRILALLIGAQLAFPNVTLATGETNCSEGPGQVNRWRGQAWQDSAEKHGASGTITGTLDLRQCVNPGLIEISGSFVYSNIEPSNGGFNDIVQVGIGICRSPVNCSGTQSYYSGWGRSSSTPGCSGYADRAPVNGEHGVYTIANHDLKVYHQSNEWLMLVDYTVTERIPEYYICWTPKLALWFGESWDYGDAIGGYVTNHAHFTSTNYANAENGGFYYTNFNPAYTCNIGGNTAPFRCQIMSSTALDIWTDNR